MIRAAIPLIIMMLLFPIMSAAQPWHLNVLWEREGLDDSSNYGHQIVALGDQNDDGFDDWAVFAVHGTYCPLAYVEFFYGGNPPSQEPYHVFQRDSVINCIRRVQAMGDLNGDHYTDYSLMVDYFNDPAVHYLFFFGGPNDDGLADTVLIPPLPVGSYSPVGDINGDGFDDLLMGRFQNGTTIIWGGDILDSIPYWHVSYAIGNRHAGDLNDDGYDDIVSVISSTNQAVVYLGGVDPDTFIDYLSGAEQEYLFTIGMIGNFDDRVGCDIGNGYGHGNSQAEVISGGPIFDFLTDYVLTFPCNYYPLVHYLGDVNADNYDDIGLWEDCYGGHGTFRLYLGNYAPSAASVLTLNAGGNPLGSMRIQDVCGVGDVNGDGVGDFAIGGHTDLEYIGFRGRAVILSGDSSYHVSSGDPHPATPSSLSLSVYPNPYNSSTQISFSLPVTSRVTLRLYDVLGREVKSLMDEMQTAGEHRVSFDGSELSSGIYLCRLQAGNMQITKKMVLMK